MQLPLSKGNSLYMDSARTDSKYEDKLKERNTRTIIECTSNSKRC